MDKKILEELTIGEVRKFRKKVLRISCVLIIFAVFATFVLLTMLLYYIDPLISLILKLKGF